MTTAPAWWHERSNCHGELPQTTLILLIHHIRVLVLDNSYLTAASVCWCGGTCLMRLWSMVWWSIKPSTPARFVIAVLIFLSCSNKSSSFNHCERITRSKLFSIRFFLHIEITHDMNFKCNIWYMQSYMSHMNGGNL